MTSHAKTASWISTTVVLVLTLVSSPFFSRAADGNPPARMTYQSYLTDANGVALGNTAPKNYDVIFRIYNDQNSGNMLWSEQQTATVDKGYFSVLLGEGSQVNAELHPSLGSLFTGSDISDRYVEMTVKGIGANGSDVIIKPRLRLMTSPYAFVALNALYAATLANSSNNAIVNVNGTCVGINTFAPTNALDVTGNARVSGTLTAGTALNVNGPVTVTDAATIAGSATIGGVLTASSLAASNATVSGTVNGGTFVGNGTIPVGGIIMWSGATNAIPGGWALCNGQSVNGKQTPNLVDRFVVGAGASYAVGSTGGATNTILSMLQIPAHTHHYKDGYILENLGDFGSNYIDGYDQLYSGKRGNGSLDSNNDTIFYRWMYTEATGAASPAPVPTAPPYYALAYIMRVL